LIFGFACYIGKDGEVKDRFDDEITSYRFTGFNNALIRLPEFDIETGGEIARDKRSDISLCCAVLLYMLRGTINQKMFTPETFPDVISVQEYPKLQYIIGKGLMFYIENRFTDAAMILNLLDMNESDLFWDEKNRNELFNFEEDTRIGEFKAWFIDQVYFVHKPLEDTQEPKLTYEMTFVTEHAKDPKEIKWKFTRKGNAWSNLKILNCPPLISLWKTCI